MTTSTAPVPTIVVLHELFGVTDHVRSVCRSLESAGFATVAPNLFAGLGAHEPLPETPQGRAAGFALLERLTIDDVVDTVTAALPAGPVGQLGLLGLSVGGYLGFRASQRLPVDRSVLLYPGWLDTSDNPTHDGVLALAQVGDPAPDTLVITGGRDALLPSVTRERIAEVICGPRHRLLVEPDAGHGFLAEHRDGHDPAAAARAWTAITDWLRPRER